MKIFYAIIEFAAVAVVFATLATIMIGCHNEDKNN